jgi:glycosyltransferase involved in cell wall biosynthesis
MAEIDVSVVIPTMVGREDLLQRAVSSVSAIGLQIEIIIVSSNADIRSHISESMCIKPYMKILVSQGDGSAASNRNLGLQEAVGRYVAFLDDDDEFTPRKLLLQSRAMKKTKANWSFSNYLLRDESHGWRQNRFSARTILRKGLDLQANCPIATPTVMFDRTAFRDESLLFDQALQTREDIDLWSRVLRLSPVLYLPSALSIVNRRRGSAFTLSQTESPSVPGVSTVMAHGLRSKRILVDRLDESLGYGHMVTWSDRGSSSRRCRTR